MLALASTLFHHGFWITSRAAGVACLLLSSAAVGVGLSMSGRLIKGRKSDLRVLHESLSLATLAALVIHAAALLGDTFLNLGVADIAVPFVSGFQRWWMAAGIIGGWMLIVLGLAYYARTRIGVERWHAMHRFTAVAWVLGLMHALGQGTDTGATWFLVAAGMVVIPAFVLLFARLNQEPAAA